MQYINMKQITAIWAYNTGNLYESNYFDTVETKNILLNWISGTGKGTLKRGVGIALSLRTNYNIDNYDNDLVSKFIIETNLRDEVTKKFNSNKAKIHDILREQFNYDEISIKFKSFISLIYKNEIDEYFITITLPKENEELFLEKYFIKFENKEKFEEFKNTTEMELLKQNTTIKEILEYYIGNNFKKNSKEFEIFTPDKQISPLINKKSIFYSGMNKKDYEKVLLLSLGISPMRTLETVSSKIIAEKSLQNNKYEEIKENINKAFDDFELITTEIIKSNENNIENIEETLELIQKEKYIEDEKNTDKILTKEEINHFLYLADYYNKRLLNEKKSIKYDIEENTEKKLELQKILEELNRKIKIKIEETSILNNDFKKITINNNNLQYIEEKYKNLDNKEFIDLSLEIKKELSEKNTKKEQLEKLLLNKEIEIKKIKTNINTKKRQLERSKKEKNKIDQKLIKEIEKKKALENNEKTVFNVLNENNKKRYFIYKITDYLNSNTEIDKAISTENINMIYDIYRQNLTKNNSNLINIDEEMEKIWYQHINNEEKNTLEYINNKIISYKEEQNEIEKIIIDLEEEYNKELNNLKELESNSIEDINVKLLNLEKIIKELELDINKLNELIPLNNKENLLNKVKKLEVELIEKRKIKEQLETEYKNYKIEEQKLNKILKELENKIYKLKEFEYSDIIKKNVNINNIENNDLLNKEQEYENLQMYVIYNRLEKLNKELSNKIRYTKTLFEKVLLKLEISEETREKYKKDRLLLIENSDNNINIINIIVRLREIEQELITKISNIEEKNKNLIDRFQITLSELSDLERYLFGNVHRVIKRTNENLKKKKSISNIHYVIGDINDRIDKTEFEEISAIISNIFNQDIDYFNGDNLNTLDYSILLELNREKIYLLEQLKINIKDLKKYYLDLETLTNTLYKKIDKHIYLVEKSMVEGINSNASGGNGMAIDDFARREFINIIIEDKETMQLPMFFDEISRGDVSDVLKTIETGDNINIYLQQGTDSVAQEIIDLSTTYESELITNPTDFGYRKERSIFKIYKVS